MAIEGISKLYRRHPDRSRLHRRRHPLSQTAAATEIAERKCYPMAKAQLNPAFDGISGRSGGIVYRRLRGETILARRPEPRARAASPAQAAQRQRFAEAVQYAREVLSDPWQRRMYEQLAQERNRRADKLVAADFLTPPVVEEIDVSGYQRRPGGIVRVLATDDIEVVAVEVAIQTADGSSVEHGPAVRIHGVWCYRTTAVPAANLALTITATAQDRPGHTGTLTVVQAPETVGAA